MFTSKGKKRATNPTGNTTATVAISTVQAKNTYSRVKASDTFSDDRKKFKAYETQCRMYL
jgi:hypothetical protein